MRDNVSESDKEFLAEFMADELTAEGIETLEEKLKDEDFRSYYNYMMDAKYRMSPLQAIAKYLPMIIMLVLIILGIYLFITMK